MARRRDAQERDRRSAGDPFGRKRAAAGRDDRDGWRAPNTLYVLGRGATFAVATEAALKLKETCAIHAEAYSSAEVLHGPAELVRPRLPGHRLHADRRRVATAWR